MAGAFRKAFRSPRFAVGFALFAAILLTILIYPALSPGDPLAMIGEGAFFPPGTYVSVYDAIAETPRTLTPEGADEARYGRLISEEDAIAMLEWLIATDANLSEVDAGNRSEVAEAWGARYDPASPPAGMTKARRNYYERLFASLQAADGPSEYGVSAGSGEGAARIGAVGKRDYVRVGDVANVVTLPLGTDNFGRDVLRELIHAGGNSLWIGLVAGALATTIGLALGLIAGFSGGFLDDAITFVANLFTVIPGFVLLILISFSLGQERRGPMTVAMVIGLTSWVWTARSVRAQVVSLRNRDHVQMSRLLGMGSLRIVLLDVLPYVASYVAMAFILQISSGILAEAQLSLLGLGSKTTETPTLGLMMSWAMLYSAHVNGAWWSYYPVILTIAAISFSLNLMNTGLDQVFNPSLKGWGRA